MKLTIGLGNPGRKYQDNRHNVGFLVIDQIARKVFPDKVFNLKSKFKAEIIKTPELILAKPDTFMNRSGEAVKKISQYFKIKPKDIYIIHDDLDIKLGQYKLQSGKGPKLHKGIKSIEEQLANKNFWRLRFGVDNRQEYHIEGEEYVLQNFTREEKPLLNKIINQVAEELVNYLKDN